MISLDDQALKLIFLITYVCEKECVTKIVFLYQQKRFAKLRKAAAVLMEVRDLLTILLDEVGAMNQLIEARRLYIKWIVYCRTWMSSFLQLSCHISFFTLHRNEQSGWLLQDFATTLMIYLKIDTLSNFIVKRHGNSVPEVTSELAKNIINRMCSSATGSSEATMWKRIWLLWWRKIKSYRL